MALIDRIKERTGTMLSDAELGAMIDAAVGDIEARYGPAGPIVVDIGDLSEKGRWRTLLRLVRPADTEEPIEIVEIDPGDSGDEAARIVLDEKDFRVLHGGRTLQRLISGPNGRTYWAPLVSVTYTPKGDQAARDEVVIKLVALDLSYRGGLKSERAGDYQFTLGGDVNQERETLLASLARQGFVLA